VVEATPAGRRILRRAQARRLDVLVGLLGGVDEADVDLLDRAATLLDRLTREHVANMVD
jgi:hypothetical protein